MNSPTEPPQHGLAPAAASDVGTTPQVDGYSSRSPAGLAPPVGQPGWDQQNRTSLAYLGEAPQSEHGGHQQYQPMSHEDVEERERREAEEMAAIEAQEKEEEAYRAAQQAQHQALYGQPSQGQGQGQPQQQEWRYETQDYSGGSGSGDHDRQSPSPQQQGERREEDDRPTGLTAPSAGVNKNALSPIVEVATPAMTVPDSPHGSDAPLPPAQQVYEYQPLASRQAAQPQPTSTAPPPIEYVRSPSVAEKRGQYGDDHGSVEAYQSPPHSAGVQSATYAQQQGEVSSPTSFATPIAAAHSTTAPLSPPPPTSPSYTQHQSYAPPPGPPPPATTTSSSSVTPTAPTASSFEPRPLTPSGQRRPVQIRPTAPEAALGSKYGDVYVPSPGAGLASPREGGGAGSYFGGAGDGGSTGGKKTVTAGAFRRPAPGGAGGAGRGSFAASGYNPEQHQPLQRSGPSESELIAAQYRSAIPLSPNLEAEEQQSMQLAGEGELPQPVTPSFDTRPLQVNKGRGVGPQGGVGAGSNGGVGRSGTLPSHLNTSHARSSSYGNSAVDAPPSPGLPYDQPLSPSSQEGFGSNRFVTKLD